jgi:ribosomal protein S3AE
MAKILKKKFFEVSLPLIEDKYEIYANSLEELKGKTVKVDVTRHLRGKSVDLSFEVKIEEGKAIGLPKKLTLLPFFIKHMLHTGIDYVEDSFIAETKDGTIIIKPFLITRKKVSRAVRRTLRNSAKNWLMDYAKTKNNEELFQEVLSNQLQKPLSLKLKKTYPLAICEIRMLQIKTKSDNKEIK